MVFLRDKFYAYCTCKKGGEGEGDTARRRSEAAEQKANQTPLFCLPWREAGRKAYTPRRGGGLAQHILCRQAGREEDIRECPYLTTRLFPVAGGRQHRRRYIWGWQNTDGLGFGCPKVAKLGNMRCTCTFHMKVKYSLISM